jgi:hypothetical protein
MYGLWLLLLLLPQRMWPAVAAQLLCMACLQPVPLPARLSRCHVALLLTAMVLGMRMKERLRMTCTSCKLAKQHTASSSAGRSRGILRHLACCVTNEASVYRMLAWCAVQHAAAKLQLAWRAQPC